MPSRREAGGYFSLTGKSHSCHVLHLVIHRSIVLCGHSAGSHLVAMVASSSWLSSLPSCDRAIFRGVVHLSGVFDLRPLLDTSINDAVGADEKEALANSPLAEDNAIRAAENSKNWKTLLFVGENDAPGLKAQGEHYAEVVSMSVDAAASSPDRRFSYVEAQGPGRGGERRHLSSGARCGPF